MLSHTLKSGMDESPPGSPGASGQPGPVNSVLGGAIQMRQQGTSRGAGLRPPPGSMETDHTPAPPGGRTPGPAWRPHPGPHPDPSGGGTATAEVPGQGLWREAPFFGASGPSAAEGLREDPARSPCGSAPSHQLLRGHERPVGGHRQGHLAGAVTPGAVTPQNHRSIRRQSQFWSRENLLKISNS